MQTQLTRQFPQLEGLSREKLDSLLAEGSQKDQAHFDALFHSLPQVKQMYQKHANLLAANEDKARSNVELQKPLEELRDETQRLFQRAAAAQAEWPLLESQMTEHYKRFTPSALQFQLNQSAAKLHDQSEMLANAFVQGETDLDDAAFVKTYKQQRIVYHRRKLVAERWARGQVHWSD